MVEVMVDAPGFWTPRIVMHMCLQTRGTKRKRSRVSYPRTLTSIGEERDAKGEVGGGGGGAENVRSLHHDGHSARLDSLLNGDRNLLGQPLLDLKSTRKRLCYPGEL